jgi:outer membrane protein OmpA-like peptidoglycan-associated protein
VIPARSGILLAGAIGAACATAGKLQSDQEVLRSEIEKARQSGAERCAPKELALAEANLDFASNEIDIGQSGRAQEHLGVAELNVKRALDLSRDCGPRQLIVSKPPPEPPKPVVVIEKVDSDGDGVPDDVDACPHNPGPAENFGCPIREPRRYALVEVKRDRIEIKQQVKFSTAQFKVLPASYPLLDQVAQVLKDEPRMRVRVEGHTDSVGGEAPNLRLSQRRADSVRAYLVAKGIAPDRLEALGYGLTKPLASNRTQKGRAQNRRTEFRIISAGN